MKIYVVARYEVEEALERDPQWFIGKYIISIFSKGDSSPLPDRYNILKLNFDDVAECGEIGWGDVFAESVIFFNEGHAKAIHDFIEPIKSNDRKEFYVHCDAGVSRSGAIGLVLNDWFNRFLTVNHNDDESFKMNNSHIMPNPLVVRLLKNELFGRPFENQNTNKLQDFCDDVEKMADFVNLSKEEFLKSYSYLKEEEYGLTEKKMNDSKWSWVVFNPGEFDEDSGKPLLWSNKDGWVSSGYDVFTSKEKREFDLPVGGRWAPQLKES